MWNLQEAEVVRALIDCGSAVWTPAGGAEARKATTKTPTADVGETDEGVKEKRKKALDELETTLRRLVTAALKTVPAGAQRKLNDVLPVVWSRDSS